MNYITNVLIYHDICNSLVIYFDTIIEVLKFFFNFENYFINLMSNKLRIKEILNERGISVTQFAEMLGIERPNVYNIFTKPTWQRLEQCSEILNMPISDFFEKDDSEINGYVEYKGKIYRITDLRSFNNLADKINSEKSKEKNNITGTIK